MFDHINSFEREGFVVVDDFLEPASTQKAIDGVGSLPVAADASRVRREVVFARRNLLGFEFIRTLIDLARTREFFETNPQALVPVRAILFDKNPAANWTVPWHQDRSIAVRERLEVPGFGPWSTKAGVVHVQPPVEILRQMITLRFHLDPCGRDNGPLRVIPATHRHIMDPREIDRTVAEQEQTICATTAGGLIAMRPLLLHASSSSRMPAHRRVVHVEFGPQTLPGGLQWAMA
jgi:hypothetical protein